MTIFNAVSIKNKIPFTVIVLIWRQKSQTQILQNLYYVIWVNWSFEGPEMRALGTYICKLTIIHNICYSFTVELSESNWASSRSQPAEERQFVHSVISVYVLSSSLFSQSSHSFLDSLIDLFCPQRPINHRFVFISLTSQKRSVLSTQKEPKRAMKQKCE